MAAPRRPRKPHGQGGAQPAWRKQRRRRFLHQPAAAVAPAAPAFVAARIEVETLQALPISSWMHRTRVIVPSCALPQRRRAQLCAFEKEEECLRLLPHCYRCCCCYRCCSHSVVPYPREVLPPTCSRSPLQQAAVSVVRPRAPAIPRRQRQPRPVGGRLCRLRLRPGASTALHPDATCRPKAAWPCDCGGSRTCRGKGSA